MREGVDINNLGWGASGASGEGNSVDILERAATAITYDLQF